MSFGDALCRGTYWPFSQRGPRRTPAAWPRRSFLRRNFCRVAAFVVVLGPLAVLRLVAADVDRCTDFEDQHKLGGITPAAPSGFELAFSYIHTVGMRSLASPILLIAEAYRRTQLFAGRSISGRSRRRVALTIDDTVAREVNLDPAYLGDGEVVGLHAGYEKLLDLLESLSLNVTFFVIANNVTNSSLGRKLLRRAYDSGHELGNHGLVDKVMANMTRAEFEYSIDTWEAIIRSIVPQWPKNDTSRKWFRSPRLETSSVMATVLEERGYSLSLPDVWSGDSMIYDAFFHARILSDAACDGSVLLMHVPDPSWGEQILDALPLAIPRLRSRGFDILRLSDLFADSETPSGGRMFLSFGLLIYCVIIPVVLFFLLIFHCSSRLVRMFHCYRSFPEFGSVDDKIGDHGHSSQPSAAVKSSRFEKKNGRTITELSTIDVNDAVGNDDEGSSNSKGFSV